MGALWPPVISKSLQIFIHKIELETARLLPDKPHRHLFRQCLHLGSLHPTDAGKLWLEGLASRKAAGRIGGEIEKEAQVFLLPLLCPFHSRSPSLTHKHNVPSSLALLQGSPQPPLLPNHHFPSCFPSFRSQQSARCLQV